MTGVTILIPIGNLFDIIIDVDDQYPCIHLYTSPKLA